VGKSLKRRLSTFVEGNGRVILATGLASSRELKYTISSPHECGEPAAPFVLSNHLALVVSTKVMRLTPDVDIPDELISASLDGSLVLFVGAGVSVNDPSNLPLFNGLASQIAGRYGESFVAANEPADAYLGRLIDRRASAREDARNILGSAASRHNQTHTAIVRLASHTKTIRLVTTNFDEHLNHAAVEAGIDLGDRFNGPAVPLARKFSGAKRLSREC
jgi:hypothetical protein